MQVFFHPVTVQTLQNVVKNHINILLHNALLFEL